MTSRTGLAGNERWQLLGIDGDLTIKKWGEHDLWDVYHQTMEDWWWFYNRGCLCVYIYIYLYNGIIWIYIVRIWYMYKYMCICIWCVYIYIYGVYIYMCIEYIYIYIYVWCMCIYIYTHMVLYGTYIYIYILSVQTLQKCRVQIGPSLNLGEIWRYTLWNSCYLKPCVFPENVGMPRACQVQQVHSKTIFYQNTQGSGIRYYRSWVQTVC